MTNDNTDPDGVAAVLRDTFRRHEQLAEGAPERLLPVLRARAGSRRPRQFMPRWLPVALAVVLAAGAVPVAFLLAGGGDDEPTVPTFGSMDEPPPPGWRWESALGLVAAVPEAWVVNDFGCNQTDRPSVVRGGGPAEDCFTPEPATKEVAIFQRWADDQPIGDAPSEDLLATGRGATAVVIDGLAAQRVTGQLEDGRYAGAVLVADRGVALLVRTRAAATTSAILDSVRLVDEDHVGCPWRRPAESAPGRPSGEYVDPAPVAVSLCYYGQLDERWGELTASGQITGEPAAQLAALVNSAPRGGNPEAPPDQCGDRSPLPSDAVLLVEGRNGTIEPLWVSWSGCVHRGVSNGAESVHVSRSLVAAIMTPLGVGYGFHSDLPE